MDLEISLETASIVFGVIGGAWGIYQWWDNKRDANEIKGKVEQTEKKVDQKK